MLDFDLLQLKWSDCTPPDVMSYPSLIIRSILCPCSPGLIAVARPRFAPISRTYKMVLFHEQGIASSSSPNLNTKYLSNVQACNTTFNHFLRSQHSVSPFPFNRYSRSCIASVNHVALRPTNPLPLFCLQYLFFLIHCFQHSQNSADMPGGVKREKLGRHTETMAWIHCNPPRNKPRAPKDDRYDPRSSEGSTTSRSTRTRRQESVHQGDGRDGYDDEYDQAEHLQAAPAPPAPRVRAARVPTPRAPRAPAPPTPAAVAPQAPAAPVPAAAAPPSPGHGAQAAATATPAPPAPNHTQNDAAQTSAAEVDAAHDDAAHTLDADEHASQTGGSPVNSEQATAGPNHEQYTGPICAQDDARDPARWALTIWGRRDGMDPFDEHMSSSSTASSSSTVRRRRR